MMKYLTILLGATTVALAIFAFRGKSANYETFITFEGWTPVSEADDVTYFWNRDHLGKGEQARRILLEKIKALPNNSIVAVFPSINFEKVSDYGMPRSWTPIDFLVQRHYEEISSKRISFHFTNFDENGRPVKGIPLN